jgi:hypothetical protein
MGDGVIEHWRNDPDRGKPMYWEKSLPQSQFVQHKSHTEHPGVEAVSTRQVSDE